MRIGSCLSTQYSTASITHHALFFFLNRLFDLGDFDIVHVIGTVNRRHTCEIVYVAKEQRQLYENPRQCQAVSLLK